MIANLYTKGLSDKSNEKYNDCSCSDYVTDAKCIRIR